jgi:hypothetical protein
MIYYPQGMELEVVSQLLRGSVNDVVVCRDRLSDSGTLYTLLAIHDRDCARKMLTVMEENQRTGEDPCILRFAQNEQMLFLFPYREERKFSAFAPGQVTGPVVAEQIGINLVMECLSTGYPWPILRLILEQDCVQISKDNRIYFTVNLDLEALDPTMDEHHCCSSCAQLLQDLLSDTMPGNLGRNRRRKQLKSYELIQKKSQKAAYDSFPELYQDIKLASLPTEKRSWASRARLAWQSHKDRLFRILLVLCVLLVAVVLLMLLSQLIFGDIPLLRLFRHTFDVIGTENLHRGWLL